MTEHNWYEDFAHENGQYVCRCLDCGKSFTGHKRRLQCKKCYIKQLEAQVEALKHKEQKAFWAGYEDARANPHLSNIQKAWERYRESYTHRDMERRLKAQGEGDG